MDVLIQIFIVLTSAGAIWLINQKKPWARWGSVIGLVGQPLWLYTSFQAEQWGVFTLTIFYMFSWSQGIYNNFYVKRKNKSAS